MTGASSDARSTLALDHLVVAARSLEEGVAWCEATFGVVPAAGGRHALMGTHNRLLAIGSERFARSYLEIVAVDPGAAPPGRARWFDLDTALMQETIAATPRLVHWAARTTAIDADVAMFRSVGHDPGTPTTAERMTPRGLLRWRITVRDDGVRPAAGAVPTLIEWGAEHPCDALPGSAVTLEAIGIGGVPAAFAARLGVDARAPWQQADAPLVAVFATPRGRVELRSPAALGPA